MNFEPAYLFRSTTLGAQMEIYMLRWMQHEDQFHLYVLRKRYSRYTAPSVAREHTNKVISLNYHTFDIWGKEKSIEEEKLIRCTFANLGHATKLYTLYTDNDAYYMPFTPLKELIEKHETCNSIP